MAGTRLVVPTPTARAMREHRCATATRVPSRVALIALLALWFTTGCSGMAPVPRRTSSSTTPPHVRTSGTSSVQAPSTTSSGTLRSSATTPVSARPTTTGPTTTGPTTTGQATSVSCGKRLAAAMTPAQRAGQLLMVGLTPTMSSSVLAAQVRNEGIGAVIYVGGWYGGAAPAATTSARLQAAAGGHLLIAADQEGGAVQQLRGPGFSAIPSARIQGTTGTVTERGNVQVWSRELRAAGINVNLAPVADTVPTSLGAANAPIGYYNRDFSRGDPTTNGRYVAAFVQASLAAGIAPTLKHFPGLGRVTGNTDTTSKGTTDYTMSAIDPYLVPFAAGVGAGAPLVMVSSAFYPRLDPANRAMFSWAVVTGLLRHRLGFTGVAITDSVSASAAADVPVGQRATRFIAAGGDIVLTTDASQTPVMLGAIAAKRAASPAFATQVNEAAARVLDLKARLGLEHCP